MNCWVIASCNVAFIFAINGVGLLANETIINLWKLAVFVIIEFLSACETEFS